MNENKYGLVIPTNSFRILCLLLERHKIQTDARINAIAHGKSLPTHSEEKPEIDAKYLLSSQPKLMFNRRQWIKANKILETLDKLQIPDVPLTDIDLILPSTYDGEKHRTSFHLINPHSPMFKRMAQKGFMPRKKLLKIHQVFRHDMKKILSKGMFRFLKASLMLMVDVNPGKNEMFSIDFVLGLRQPFMHKVVATSALWECTDYEVF